MVIAGFKKILMPNKRKLNLNIGLIGRNRLLRNTNLILKSNVKNAQIINALGRLNQSKLLIFNDPGINLLRNVARELQNNFNKAVENMNIDAKIQFKPSHLKLSPKLKMEAKKGAKMIKNVL